MNTQVPSWPSLYYPAIEIVGIEHRAPVQPDGHYLYNSYDVFRFTLYWTLILYTPIFILCGVYAFLNLTFPPSPSNATIHMKEEAHSLHDIASDDPQIHRLGPRIMNERRSRLTFALLVLFTFLALSVTGAVVAAAVGGYVLAGFFNAANFNMSTWIPFLWAATQTFVGLLGIWPSIIEII